MKIHYDIIQGTDEWREIRRGKLTGSHGTEIGNNGAGLKTYVKSKLLEIILGVTDDNYQSADMIRGNELEPIARSKYEFEYNVEVIEAGFVEYDEYSGFSPDGLVGDAGGIEIKARNDAKHLEHLLGAKVDSGTMWQIQCNLLMSGRKWWDFISYNPNFRQSLHIERIFPDKDKHDKLLIGLESGAKMLNDMLLNENIIKELEKQKP